MATQLRRYDVIEGQMDSLVEWFPNIIAVREKFGFKSAAHRRSRVARVRAV